MKRLRAIGAAILFASMSMPALAQTFPDRPIRAVIPFPAGGAADVLARIVLEKTASTIGQPFIIEN